MEKFLLDIVKEQGIVDMILNYRDEIDTNELADMISKDNFDYFLINFHNKISENQLRIWYKLDPFLDWNYVCRLQTLSEDFIKKYGEKLDWHYLYENKHIDNKMLDKF